jgi:hypothetical protein
MAQEEDTKKPSTSKMPLIEKQDQYSELSITEKKSLGTTLFSLFH